MFRKVIFVLMMCVFQLGLCLLLLPVFNGVLLDRQAGQAAQSFLTQVDTPIEETQSTGPTEETIPYQQLWDEMCAYNETLYAEKQVNSEFVVMLNQAESDQERLSKLLNISPEQMSYVNGSDAGCGLMRYGNALVPFVNRFPCDTELYKLITTRPGEGVFAKGQVDDGA